MLPPNVTPTDETDRAPSPREDSNSAQLSRGLVVTGIALAVLAALVIGSLALGSQPLSVAQAWRGLVAHDNSVESLIVWRLRIPRTLLAVAVGASLALAGVLMQALTRNPLAEPGLLGVNAGAALAVVLGITLLGAASVHAYVWLALLGAATAAVFVHLISLSRTPRHDHTRLVLAGAALSASLGAVTGTITMFDADAFDSYRFWVVGSVAERGADALPATLPFIAIGAALALGSGPTLNVLALGDEQATSLGVRLPIVRGIVFCAVTTLCAAATAAAGPIGFVGLLVPHAGRLLLGADQRTLLGAALVGGPIVVLSADLIGRLIARPGEVEVGIVTAMIGAPVLLALVWRRSAR